MSAARLSISWIKVLYRFHSLPLFILPVFEVASYHLVDRPYESNTPSTEPFLLLPLPLLLLILLQVTVGTRLPRQYRARARTSTSTIFVRLKPAPER